MTLDYTILALCSLVAFAAGCGNGSVEPTDEEYVSKINAWHQQRVQELKQEDSWLSLAGLYGIEEGRHTFGSDSTNDIIFPAKAPGRIGTIVREDSMFAIEIADKLEVYRDSSAVSEINFTVGNSGDAPVLRHKSLLWYIIERRGRYYIRLKDTDHPNFENFGGIERFPVSKKWRVKAIFNRFEEPKTITIPDILGDTYRDSLFGTLTFRINGERYSLAPLGNPRKEKKFFIIFGDKTNGNSTYSGGRYVYVPAPEEDGTTFIDFNKAYNPPCVFTDFATCPLPPAQNRLELEVKAGEKVYNLGK